MRQATPPLLLRTLLLLIFYCCFICCCCHLDNRQAQGFALAAGASQQQQQQPDDDFFFLCSGGKTKQLEQILEKHPHFVHSTTRDDEHCLHLAGIQGFPTVTELFLRMGANPNVRSNSNTGLRMTPLSWNVYINQYDNCKLLLDYGADVNLDFDHVTDHKTSKKMKITVLDLIELISSKGGDEFDKLKQLLLQHGAKTYKELIQQEQEQ